MYPDPSGNKDLRDEGSDDIFVADMFALFDNRSTTDDLGLKVLSYEVKLPQMPLNCRLPTNLNQNPFRQGFTSSVLECLEKKGRLEETVFLRSISASKIQAFFKRLRRVGPDPS